MLRLRPYKPCDAEKIVSWCGDESVFFKWGGSLIGEFPLSAEQLNEVYIKQYAFDILKVDEVTIGVYHNNPGAEHCYRSLGFVDNPKMENTVKIINGEEWIVKELIVTRDTEKKSL